jgi:hypothetical protein
MESYEIEAGFPINGLTEVTPYSDQETGTSASMLNVFPFDSSGRLRGSRRPGVEKWCPDQVSGTNKVQCLTSISATKVEPVLGDGRVWIKGTKTGTTNCALLASATGVESTIALATPLGAVFGPDGYVYVVAYSGSNIQLSSYDAAGSAVLSPVTMFVDGSAAPADLKLLGMAIDEDTVFIWYSDIDNIGEGIVRATFAGVNRDSSTSGVFIRAETDATSIEKVFGGVANAGWSVLPSTSHHGMKLYLGKLAIVGAPLKDGGTSTEHELVLYIVDLKTGIVDAIHDLGLDGTASSADKGIVRDIEFGLDGFIYVLMRDNGTDNTNYLRKIDGSGNGIWEIQMSSSCTPMSISWNPKRSLLAICGDTLFEDTNISLALIDVDSKGVVEYCKPVVSAPSVLWSVVRCDREGNFYLSRSTRALRLSADLVTNLWYFAVNANDQNRIAINTYWNSGSDEQGSQRYQVVLGVSNGTIKKITTSGATSITGGTSVLSTTAQTIYSANFGVLTFFADGEGAYYYDASADEVYNWTDEVVYGILPNDMNGGFPYIEQWNRRLVIFGVEDDPSNWYMSAKNNPFDWKQQTNVTGASISGRTSPAGLYPGRLYGVIPYNDDLAIFAGDHTMYQLSGDPATTSTFDLITDTVGIAPGRAWCKDGFGAVYFFGNNGGIYKMSLNSPPQRISNKSIDKQFENVDLPNSVVHLVWDSLLQGIHVYITPVTPAMTTQYFFDFRTEGWFPYALNSKQQQPYSVTVSDPDEPQDRKILMGGNDGYVRSFNASLLTDDGVYFEAYFMLGPWIPRTGTGSQVMMHRMDLVVGSGSGLDVEVQSGADAQNVIESGRSKYETHVKFKQANIHHPMVSGRAVALKVKSRDLVSMGFESFRATMSDARYL